MTQIKIEKLAEILSGFSVKIIDFCRNCGAKVYWDKDNEKKIYTCDCRNPYAEEEETE